jgi:DNA-binding MarR family transcriptional regulator
MVLLDPLLRKLPAGRVAQVAHPPACYGSAMSPNVTAPALPFDPIASAAKTWEERIGPSVAMSAVTNIMRVQQILQATVDERLKPHGLSFARYEALVLLSFSQRGSLPMRMMGERLQLHPTSITNIVDRLESDGLARRLPHPSDRRTTLVELTEAGRDRLTGATAAVTGADFGFVGLDEPELDQLSVLLTKVRRAAGDFA